MPQLYTASRFKYVNLYDIPFTDSDITKYCGVTVYPNGAFMMVGSILINSPTSPILDEDNETLCSYQAVLTEIPCNIEGIPVMSAYWCDIGKGLMSNSPDSAWVRVYILCSETPVGRIILNTNSVVLNSYDNCYIKNIGINLTISSNQYQ